MSIDLVFEIGTEELPSKVVDIWTGRNAADTDSYPERVKKKLWDAGLTVNPIKVFRMYGTARRLVLIAEVMDEQRKTSGEARGPSVAVAFDEAGSPTKAAEGFARSRGIDVESLERMDKGDGEYVYASFTTGGRPTREVLAEVLPAIVTDMPLPKTMRWGSGDLRFSRPIQWLTCVLGGETLPVQLEGLSADNITYGHRFRGPDAITITGPDQYVSALADAHVILDQDARREACQKEIERVASSRGLKAAINNKVLNEVTNLVESVNGAFGEFNEDFLALPREVLVTSMESHQRYFPVENASGGIAPGFVVIHNGDPAAEDIIVKGHQKVISARLSDAHFFYHEDKKTQLKDRVERLGGVTFHRKLGTLLDKVQRLDWLIEELADQLPYEDHVRENALLAARLCKADLVTGMVVEFPVLQGTMGRDYALAEGLPGPVADAIYEHYLPKSRQEDLFPTTTEGTMLALCDKLDSVVAFLAVGISPSGSEDPYALRRQATGVVRLIIKNEFHVDLPKLVDSVLSGLHRQDVRWEEDSEGHVARRAEIAGLILDQMKRGLLSDGVRHDVIDAVIAPVLKQDDPLAFDIVDLVSIAKTVADLLGGAELDNVISSYVRCRNLAKGVEVTTVHEEYLEDQEEKDLAQAFKQFDPAYDEAIEAKDYKTALGLLSGLRDVVDGFFDAVLVMATQDELRQNRQALLAHYVGCASQIVDFGKIVSESDR